MKNGCNEAKSDCPQSNRKFGMVLQIRLISRNLGHVLGRIPLGIEIHGSGSQVFCFMTPSRAARIVRHPVQ